jgi:putative ABC transport system permease protein
VLEERRKTHSKMTIAVSKLCLNATRFANVVLRSIVLNIIRMGYHQSVIVSSNDIDIVFHNHKNRGGLMRYGELARFAIGGLWRQKVRTALTLIGVTIGTCALAFSLSLGLGLREFIDHEFKSRDDFWRLIVRVDDPQPDTKDVPRDKLIVRGEMSEDRRERIREALLERYLSTHPRKPRVALTPEKLAAIAALPDVVQIRTFRNSDARVMAAGAEKPVNGFAVTGPIDDLHSRLIAGHMPASDGSKQVLLSELVLYDLGWHSDADLHRAIGMPVRVVIGGVRNAPPLALARILTGRIPGEEMTAAQAIVLEKLATQLPQKLDMFDLTLAEKAELTRLLEAKPDQEEERARDSMSTAADTYFVCGVTRLLTREDRKKSGPLSSWELAQGSVFFSPEQGSELFNRLPWARDVEVHSADVRVRPGGDLPGTVADVEAMGFGTWSSVKWFANAKREVTMIAGGLNLFALIALFVAGIGITNTLVTSVVERTKEIGILRAVGATRGQILGLFLTEGTFIGLLGSGLGLALARGLAIPADHWVWTLIEKQAEGEKLVTMTVFVFPWWLWIGAILFAVAVTTAAAFYPARRAARIHPIEALRYG